MNQVDYASLPEDMQCLIGDFLALEDTPTRLHLPTIPIAVEEIPFVPLDESDRGTGYAREIDLDLAPPIVVADGHFLDGKHRVFRARELGLTHLVAIDLTGLIDAGMLSCNSMGAIGSRDPSPSP